MIQKNISTSKCIINGAVLIALILIICNSKNAYTQEKKAELSELEKIALSIKSIPAIGENDTNIQLPSIPEGYKIELKGTDRFQVIDKNGNITKPLVDADVSLYYQLINLSTEEREDIPNILVTVPGNFNQNDSDNPCPDIIPALREWKGGQGFYILPDNGTITLDPDCFSALQKSAELFANDLSFFSDKKYSVEKGNVAGANIFISTNCADKALGEEGYILTIDKGITLEANTIQGVFMGTRTILQLLNLNDSKIPNGTVRDYPKYARRGFMIDVGRKFFSMEFLRNYVKIMSYYKMNEFHVHLNDNGFKQFFENDWSKTYSAFRLESETYPGLTAKDGSYSKKDFTELQKLGMEYGVNVIPEIDVPAHSLAFTKYMPEIGSKEYGIDHLDINNPKTYEFLDKLFDEYLSGENPVFIGPDVHVGTDEYDKKEAESFRKFTDYYLKKVQSYGKRARFWGSLTHAAGTTPVTSDNVIINAWYNGYADPQDMIDQGYELISTSDRHLYIVPAAGYYYDYLNLKFLYDKWEPNLIGGDVFPFGHPQITGGMFAVWNDHCGNGITEKDVHHRVFPALQVLAQKMWHGQHASQELNSFNKIAANLVEAPDVNIMAKIPHQGNVVLRYDFTKNKTEDFSINNYNLTAVNGAKWESGKGYFFDKKSSITLPVEEIGYPYEVSVEITFNGELNSESFLFSSKNAKVIATPLNGKIELSFKREGYHYKFKTLIDKNKRQLLKIKGDNKGTALCIDGEEVERLQGIVEEYKKENGKPSNMYIQQTLVFPLRKIGHFDGIIHQLSIISN